MTLSANWPSLFVARHSESCPNHLRTFLRISPHVFDARGGIPVTDQRTRYNTQSRLLSRCVRQTRSSWVLPFRVVGPPLMINGLAFKSHTLLGSVPRSAARARSSRDSLAPSESHSMCN